MPKVESESYTLLLYSVLDQGRILLLSQPTPNWPKDASKRQNRGDILQ